MFSTSEIDIHEKDRANTWDEFGAGICIIVSVNLEIILFVLQF
jgi:hypothetical protein